MIKGLSAITKYKNGITKIKATDKLSVKSIILPDVHESDDSTINFTKRVGGEMIQCYSLSEVKLKQPDICMPTFKEVIFSPCRSTNMWIDVPCESSIFDFEVELPKDFDFKFTTRNTTVIPEYDYETGTYIPGEFPTTPLTLSLTLKDIEGFWSLKRNNELLYSSEQMPPLDTNKEIYEGGDFDYDIKFSLDIGEGSVGAVNVYEFKGQVSELGILTRNNAVATGELEIDYYDSINISKYKFTTINVDLILPDYFPDHITTARHMFSSSSIKDSSLSSWNVSNVMNMSGMFSAVNFKNNVDLSSWVTTKVIDMSSMFSNAFNFNSNLKSWDVSNVLNMDFMFANSPSFNQDLSQWCVSKITTAPEGFDADATSWTLAKPVWGTCPSEVDPEEPPVDSDLEGFVFSVQNINSSDTTLRFVLDKGVYNTDTWALKDSLNTVVASNDGIFNQEFSVYNNSGTLEINIPIYDNKETYQFVGKGSLGSLQYYSEELPYPATVLDLPSNPEIRVYIEEFSETIESYQFYVDCVDFKVPNQLAPHIVNCDSMFKECYFFNQDLSSWNVSNVTNMDYMFESALSFNQDLSNWCVDKISIKPNKFDSKAESWISSKPIWGTCPGGIPVEPTENLISYLNINLVPQETSNTKISYINITTSSTQGPEPL